MEGVDWGPALAFLALGLVLGGLILWRTLAAAPAATASSALERRDLEAKLEAMVAQLRELDLLAGTSSGDPAASERWRMELEAARALGALERVAGSAKKRGRERAAAVEAAAVSTPGAPAVAAPHVPAPASSLKGFFWGVGSAAAIGLVLWFASRSAQERGAGGSVTGSVPGATRAAQGQAKDAGPTVDAAELAALQERVRAHPDDDAARLDLARLHLIRQDMMAVFNETQAVLARNPRSGRALSYQALVRLAMGQGDRAEQMLKTAIESEPDLLDGYTHLMAVYIRMGREPDAKAVLASATRRFPVQAAQLEGLFAQLREAGADEAAASSGEDPHAGVPAPGEVARTSEAPAPPAAAPRPGGAAATARRVAGTLELDASARARFAPGSVVFVMLRDAGFGAGPPLAVRRLVAQAFPLAFEIGEGDSMSGEPVPDEVLIEARLDTDGDPVTRPRSDPYGSADRVRLGRTDVRILLTPRE
jgi:tetratricopeptide (TPR) repeat protein